MAMKFIIMTKKNNFTILQYKINNAGKSFVNTIYITYAEGRIEN